MQNSKQSSHQFMIQNIFNQFLLIFRITNLDMDEGHNIESNPIIIILPSRKRHFDPLAQNHYQMIHQMELGNFEQPVSKGRISDGSE